MNMEAKCVLLFLVLILLSDWCQGKQSFDEVDGINKYQKDWLSTFSENITLNIIGAIIFGGLIALCNVAGIGGAGINASVCIILFGLTAKQTLAISSFCNSIGAFVRFILNFDEKHPFREATSIDYTIVMMMFPMFLLGTMIGTKLSIAIPDAFILLFTTFVLAFLSVQTTTAAINLRRKEIDSHGKAPKKFTIGGNENNQRSIPSSIRVIKANGDNDNMIIHERQNSLVSKYESATCDEMNDIKSRIQASEENEDMLRRITEKENTHCKPFSLFIVIIVFLINISKGTPKVQSPFGVEACSLADYILFAAFMVFLILMAAISIFIAKEEYNVKRDCQYEFYEGDIVWTSKMIIQISLFFIIKNC